MVLGQWESIAGNLVLTNGLKNVNWPPLRVKKLTFRALALRQSDSLRLSL